MFLFNQFNLLPKSISGLLIVVLIANMVLFAAIFQPKPAEAGIPVSVIADVTAAAKWVWDAAKLVWERTVAYANLNFDAYEKLHGTGGIIEQAISLTLALALHQLLAKVTNDIIAWINGGYRGKPRIMQDFGKALDDSLDEAAGVVMGAITGLDPKTLCDASYLKLTLAPAFAGPYAVPTFEEKVQCTFSGMADGLRKFQQDFSQGGWPSFVKYLEKPNNQIGQTLLVAELKQGVQEKKKNEFVAETTANRGYLAQKKCTITKAPVNIGGYSTTETMNITQGYGSVQVPKEVYEGAGTDAQMRAAMQAKTGDDLDSLAKRYNIPVEELKGAIIANGGMIECKIVTPAQQISDLATNVMEKPIRAIEKAQSDMMEKIGEKAPAVIKPYVMAIGATLLNDMMKRGKGLIASAFQPPKKDRKINRQNTSYLQNNTALSQSSEMVANSANDFRSFLLKAAIEFNQYVASIGRVLENSDVLGRPKINKVEFDTMGGIYQEMESGPSLQRQVLDLVYGPKNDWGSPGREHAGWLTNIDCNEQDIYNSTDTNKFGDANNNGFVRVSLLDNPIEVVSLGFNATIHQVIFVPSKNATTTVAVAGCIGNDTKQKILTTYAPGKIFFDEARWCGAYSQELDLPFSATQATLEPMSDTILTSDMNMCGSSSCPTKSMVYRGTLTSPNWALNTYEGYNTVGYLTGDLASQISHNIEGPGLIDGGDLEMETHIYKYDDNDDGEPDRFVRISSIGEDINNDGIPDASPNVANAHRFAETLVHSYADLNGDGTIDKISGDTDAAIYTEVMPLFDEPNNVNELIQPAAAHAIVNNQARNYAFGGYNQFGFSNLARDITNNTTAKLPIRFAGAQAVYFPPNGRIYIFGGMNETGLLDTVLEFSPSNGGIRVMSAHLPEKTTGLSGAYVASTGRIYLFGGSTENGVKNWILEYNQQTDSITTKVASLPKATANSAAVVSSPSAGKQMVYIIGGKDQNGLALSSIIEYNPRAADDSAAAITEKSAKIIARAYHAAYPQDPANPREIIIIGGQDENGLVAHREMYDPVVDRISRTILPNAKHRSQMGFTINSWSNDTDTLIGGIRRDDASRLYPQGDIYYIPQRVDAKKTTELFWQKHFSPRFENGSASLLNFKESTVQKDPTATILNPYTRRETNANSDEVWMAPPFYPEMLEDAQELMEKVRVIRGYNYGRPWERNYTSPLPIQLGAIPDDDPGDNLLDGYEGSLSDVLYRFGRLSEIYQSLFAGTTDESTLEGVDPEMKWLTPEETNIKVALIGQRCPALQPSATSTPDLREKCPPLGPEYEDKYNMQKRFVFEPDGISGKTDIITGFATNPFTGKKSSVIAGALNLDEMATQLQAAPPDANIIKLVRLRQILEQLQVPVNSSGKTRPIVLPGKAYASTTPSVFTGVDLARVDIPGYEKIQDYLNDTTTRNLDIQTLVEAYGYTTAKEAYPEISKELDGVWQDIINQVTDKLKDVFLQRTEKALEEARLAAQNRAVKFIEYSRNIDPYVRYEFDADNYGQISRFQDLDKNNINIKRVSADTYILEINTAVMFKDPAKIEKLLERDSSGEVVGLSDNDRNAIIGTAAYKIKSLAKFIGEDIQSEQFGAKMSQYLLSPAKDKDPFTLDSKVKNILRDTYIYYTGIFNFSDPLLAESTDRTITASVCKDKTGLNEYKCELSVFEKGIDNSGVIGNIRAAIRKDARTKLDELSKKFDLMLAEIDSIKDEYMELSSKVKERGNDMEEMANLLSVMVSDYDKANACIGMPTDPEYSWKVHTGRLGWATLGMSYLTDIPILGDFIKLLFVGPIDAFFGFSRAAKKRAKKKYRQEVARIANNCKDGMGNYNKHLGQLADLFLCNQQNPIYED